MSEQYKGEVEVDAKLKLGPAAVTHPGEEGKIYDNNADIDNDRVYFWSNLSLQDIVERRKKSYENGVEGGYLDGGECWKGYMFAGILGELKLIDQLAKKGATVEELLAEIERLQNKNTELIVKIGEPRQSTAATYYTCLKIQKALIDLKIDFEQKMKYGKINNK
ncbi:hypothetical protein KBC54_01565 [Patescibacteria group bacterium]|nr:hypothetical protein [Patescibacteria group bacterium]